MSLSSIIHRDIVVPKHRSLVYHLLPLVSDLNADILHIVKHGAS